MINNYWILFFILFTSAFFCTKKLIPHALDIGTKYGIVDLPNSRKKQNKPVVRFGGLSILITLLLISIFSYIFINNNYDYFKFNLFWPIILVGFLFYLIGSSDDFLNLRPLPRLFSQFLFAFYICSNGLIIERVDISFLSFQYQFISIPRSFSILITVIWIVGITNSVNWIDGLDGLATGISLSILLGILILSFLSGNVEVLILSCILTGSCLAFLIYNFFPAKIYLGDGGSYLLGFMISTLSLLSFINENTLLNPLLIILLVLLPFIDMIRVIILRILSKKSPFLPDRNHIHHFLIDSGISHKNSVLTLYSLNIVFVGLAVFIAIFPFN